MNGLKFCVIAFCWLDSTVRTAEETSELFVAVFELLPQAASSAAAANAVQAAGQRRRLIHRFIEDPPPLSDKRVLSRMWTCRAWCRPGPVAYVDGPVHPGDDGGAGAYLIAPSSLRPSSSGPSE